MQSLAVVQRAEGTGQWIPLGAGRGCADHDQLYIYTGNMPSVIHARMLCTCVGEFEISRLKVLQLHQYVYDYRHGNCRYISNSMYVVHDWAVTYFGLRIRSKELL